MQEIHGASLGDALDTILAQRARRVGAHAALLLRADGRLLASHGPFNPDSARSLAIAVARAVAAADLLSGSVALGAFVDVSVSAQAARAYVRRLAADRLLATVFADEAPAHATVPAPFPTLQDSTLQPVDEWCPSRLG